MTALAEKIRKGRKYDQVLNGAREIFLRDGFEGASVDDIAHEASVSKATLYSYFPDKRLLFMEVVKAECLRQADAALDVIDLNAPVEQVLESAAKHLVAFLLSDFGQGIYRICVAESDRFPELGAIFYDSGPAHVHAQIVEFLTCAISRGELVIEDVPLAADQFAELCKTDLFLRLVFGQQRSFSKDEIDRVIQGAVEMFMARYGTKG